MQVSLHLQLIVHTVPLLADLNGAKSRHTYGTCQDRIRFQGRKRAIVTLSAVKAQELC